MVHQFRLEQFPGAVFTISIGNWSGKKKMYKDSKELERSKEKGKPFLVKNLKGEEIKIYLKRTSLDPIPFLVINGENIHIVKKLAWYDHVIAMIPFLLLTRGGALGGVIAVAAIYANYNILRGKDDAVKKYAKVVFISVLMLIAFFFAAVIFTAVIEFFRVIFMN